MLCVCTVRAHHQAQHPDGDAMCGTLFVHGCDPDLSVLEGSEHAPEDDNKQACSRCWLASSGRCALRQQWHVRASQTATTPPASTLTSVSTSGPESCSTVRGRSCRARTMSAREPDALPGSPKDHLQCWQAGWQCRAALPGPEARPCARSQQLIPELLA
jgi:hypothetical protein